MSIIEQQSVEIKIVNTPGDARSKLQLNYQGQSYNLYQAFPIPKLDRAEQQWRQLKAKHGDRYLLVRELDYYSLWEIEHWMSGANLGTLAEQQEEVISPERADRLKLLSLQQASLWLFQELWLQLIDSVGSGQLKLSTDNLVATISPLQGRIDLDRLLDLDPLIGEHLDHWTELDFITLDREVYQIAQHKLGHQFATELTIDITQAMPDALRLTLERILDI